MIEVRFFISGFTRVKAHPKSWIGVIGAGALCTVAMEQSVMLGFPDRVVEEPNLPHLLTKHQKPPKPHLTIHTHTSTSPLRHNRATIWRETSFFKTLSVSALKKFFWISIFAFSKMQFSSCVDAFFSLGTPIRKLRFVSGERRRGQNGKKLLLIFAKRIQKSILENGENVQNWRKIGFKRSKH